MTIRPRPSGCPVVGKECDTGKVRYVYVMMMECGSPGHLAGYRHGAGMLFLNEETVQKVGMMMKRKTRP